MDDHGVFADGACTACRSTNLTECIELSGVPVYCNAVCATRKDALEAPRGDIRLVFCRACGHVYNKVFDPALADYGVEYENSLHASTHFQRYAQDTVDRLIERYNLRGKQVLEIGSGRGEFLALLCERGDNRGVGVDPSHGSAHNSRPGHPQVELIQDHYSRRYAERRVDLMCCRHVLEHIASPRNMLEEIRETIGNRFKTVVFFEVPNVLYTLRDMGIWDIIYEHCSYFSPTSLRRIFESCGFEVLDLGAAYGEQFLHIEALPATASGSLGADKNGDLEELTALVAAFGEGYRTKVARWERELTRMTEGGRRVAAWGGGSKGVTFLNTIGAGRQVDCVVDINRRKQGMFIPGTAQPIVAPRELAERKIDVILVMNPVYRDEIGSEVRALDSAAEILCV